MSKKSSKRRSKGRGAIVVISMLLISSACIRLGGAPGQAVAQALTQPVTADAPIGDQPELEAAINSIPNPKPLDRVTTSGLLDALREREMRVETAERQMEIRRKALKVADKEISKRLKMLEQAEANLRQTLTLADSAAENDLSQLTTVYENMKPKDAAALFAAMEPDFAAGFLGRMRADAAAAIMTGLPPEIAYSISAILAGRHANVPKS